MMKHLSPQQFVEAIDGTLATSRLAHLEECETCRREIADLRALMSDVQLTTDAPEPSPLFWDLFSQRVRTATSTCDVPVQSWWHGAWRPLAAVAMVAAVTLVAVRLRPPTTVSTPDIRTAESANVPSAVGDEFGSPPQDESLNFVVQLASNMAWDDLRQVAQPTRDVTAATVDQLTPAQCAELARLVKAAMDGAE